MAVWQTVSESSGIFFFIDAKSHGDFAFLNTSVKVLLESNVTSAVTFARTLTTS